MSRNNKNEEISASDKKFYLLTREQCNGEWCEASHFGLFSSVEEAKTAQAKLVTPDELKGEDAINKWCDTNEKGVIEFRTGNWGYITYEIRELVLGECVAKYTSVSPSLEGDE